ncbi:MAG: Shedu anti-phage system protein SduA domain-containing protein [Planctomycetota bacterium]
MSKELKTFRISFNRGKLSEINNSVVADIQKPSQEAQEIVKRVGATVGAYRKAVEELLSNKYAHLRQLTPRYLSNPGKVLVLCCTDGVVIRFEQKVDEKKMLCGWIPETISEAAAKISENVIHCYSDRNFTSTIPTDGVELKLFRTDGVTKEQNDICAFRIGFDAVVKQPKELPKSPHKPYCLLSVKNSFEIEIHGVLVGKDQPIDEGQRMLIRSKMSLPVGWECIEVYPFFELERWEPEYASVWAEKDLLAAMVVNQVKERHYESLDPKATARGSLARILKAYKALLQSNPDREEVLQCFLRDNPWLLCPTYAKMWPKLSLGAYTTDFVFREAAGDYLLVELERPDHRLFIKKGDASTKLNHAKGQILDWKRYIEDNPSTVKNELALIGISTNPNSLVVIGRSHSLSPANRRKLVSIENQCPKVKIMTYDDVYENAKAVIENLLGPLWDVGGNTQIYYLPNK